MLWQVLYSHGIPALACLYLLLALIARRMAAAVSPAGLWLSALPVIAAVITPFYSYIDPNMSVLFFAVGLGLAGVDAPINRDRAGRGRVGRARPGPVRVGPVRVGSVPAGPVPAGAGGPGPGVRRRVDRDPADAAR
jgi:hypothetical protein